MKQRNLVHCGPSCSHVRSWHRTGSLVPLTGNVLICISIKETRLPMQRRFWRTGLPIPGFIASRHHQLPQSHSRRQFPFNEPNETGKMMKCHPADGRATSKKSVRSVILHSATLYYVSWFINVEWGIALQVMKKQIRNSTCGLRHWWQMIDWLNHGDFFLLQQVIS